MANHTDSAATLRSARPAAPPGKPIPELSGGWPLLGHLPEFQRDPVAMLDRCWQEHGELVRSAGRRAGIA